MPEKMSEREELTPNQLELLAASIKKTEATSENLPILRLEVAILREKEGMERLALESISWVRKGAERIGAHEDVVDLIWENSLVGKHYIMRARDNRNLNSIARSLFPAYGFYLMTRSAKESTAYINAHNVETKRPRLHRFVGEVSALSRDYRRACEHYRLAVELFAKMDDPIERTNALELSGFLAESLILSGRTGEGISLAESTFAAYDTDDGVQRKEQDYFTWAVWKSGCAIKAWHALLHKGISVGGETKDRLIAMLQESEKIVYPPPEIKIWGDFTLRRNEIAALKRSLKLN